MTKTLVEVLLMLVVVMSLFLAPQLCLTNVDAQKSEELLSNTALSASRGGSSSCPVAGNEETDTKYECGHYVFYLGETPGAGTPTPTPFTICQAVPDYTDDEGNQIQAHDCIVNQFIRLGNCAEATPTPTGGPTPACPPRHCHLYANPQEGGYIQSTYLLPPSDEECKNMSGTQSTTTMFSFCKGADCNDLLEAYLYCLKSNPCTGEPVGGNVIRFPRCFVVMKSE